MSDGPVLFLDSGIGGLSVLREARILLPHRRFVYVADDAAFPYGDWDETDLRERIVGLVRDLAAEHAPALVTIACNTATTIALSDLRDRMPGLPFVGTVPAIKPAAERTQSGHISVLATPGTVRREYTSELISRFAKHARVTLVGSARLAGIAEAYLRGAHVPDEAIRQEIAPCFVSGAAGRTDIVVLACTHFPFLANQFRRLAPWPVDWLDPAEAIAHRMLDLVGSGPDPDAAAPALQDIAIMTSGPADMATRRLFAGFGLRTR